MMSRFLGRSARTSDAPEPAGMLRKFIDGAATGNTQAAGRNERRGMDMDSLLVEDQKLYHREHRGPQRTRSKATATGKQLAAGRCAEHIGCLKVPMEERRRRAAALQEKRTTNAVRAR